MSITSGKRGQQSSGILYNVLAIPWERRQQQQQQQPHFAAVWRQTSLVPVKSQKYNHIKSVGMTIELPSSISLFAAQHYDDDHHRAVNRISEINAASSALKDLPTQ